MWFGPKINQRLCIEFGSMCYVNLRFQNKRHFFGNMFYMYFRCKKMRRGVLNVSLFSKDFHFKTFSYWNSGIIWQTIPFISLLICFRSQNKCTQAKDLLASFSIASPTVIYAKMYGFRFADSNFITIQCKVGVYPDQQKVNHNALLVLLWSIMLHYLITA